MKLVAVLVVLALVGRVAAGPVSRPLYYKAGVQQASPVRAGAAIATDAGDDDEPVWGDLYPAGIFWTYIEIGNPPVAFPVAIDSGSFTLDVPAINCQGCPTKAPNAQYDFTKSSSSTKTTCTDDCQDCADGQCKFSNTYETCDLSNPTAPCTISGRWYTDQVKLGPLGPVNVSFGAIDYQTTNFDQFKIVDGVLGMAGPAGSTNVFQSLVDAGLVPENVWALCLVHGPKSNGTITYGGIDPRLYKGTIQYVPNISQDMYTVTLKGISVGGAVISGTRTQAILDTGTNVLLLPTAAFNSFKKLLTAGCAQHSLLGVCGSGKTLFDGACFNYTADDLAAFPPLTFALDGVTLTMSASQYLVNVDGAAPSSRCLGVRPTGVGGFLIIGDTTMQPYYVVFDRARHRIGWAPVDADNCGTL